MAHRHERRERSNGSAHTLAQGLGWFSIGLGLTELLAPRMLGRCLGMEEHTGLIRAYGVREIAAGAGILSQRDPTFWVWSRVAGDALDLATLAPGLARDNPQRANVGLAIAAVAGAAVLDVICAQALNRDRGRYARAIPDYSDRSGLPRSPEAMRGAARDFEAPRDMRTPEAMRPYATA